MSQLRTRKQTARSRPLYPPETWVWQGSAAHFICADRCAFHLTTVIGPWIVSTVGEYKFRDDTADAPWRTVGADRLYETMVFRAATPKCEREWCAEFHTANGHALAFREANTRAEAHAAHTELCKLFACRGPRWRKRS